MNKSFLTPTISWEHCELYSKAILKSISGKMICLYDTTCSEYTENIVECESNYYNARSF